MARCPQCEGLLPADAVEGLCPQCLLRLAVMTEPIAADTLPFAGPVEERPEHQFGPYRVVRVLGEGGMGTVYLAEQHEPIRRLVALKVIKLGMSTREVMARFDSERQSLAMMDHPHIARVFDAGASPQGRPYFVMEYVNGIPITEYCDRHRLNNRERIELFAMVCQAVHHAHQKGIIHRDIKPSNVLVGEQDGKPFPKVIDFGIAKAIDQRAMEQTTFTELGKLVGTPEYMSPEQTLLSANIDTTTDVYSLGVLLYELLAGALPFEGKRLRAAGLAELLRIIREEDPPTPSQKVSQMADTAEVAARRRTDAVTLRRQLSGDLNWIVMKALEKERARRYASVSELAADVRRHLEHHPVLAGPPSRLYRTRKFVQRHRMVVTAGALVAASLVAGMISTGWEAHVAEGRGREAIRQRNRADSEAAVARDARRAAESSAQEAKKSEAKAIDSLGSLQRAQADLQKSLDLQKGLTREARIKELIADAAQWQAADPALALYLGLFVAQAGRPLPSGLEDILSTSLENRPSYAVLRDRGVNALTWSPDGKSLATNGAEGLRVWDPATGLPLRSFPRAGTTPTWASVTSIAWSPDGRSIASVSHNGVILLLDPANGKVSRTLQDLSRVDWGVPSAVAWSPDGRTLAASTWDRLGLRPPPVRVIRLWSAATGELQRAISSSNSAVYSVAWSPDGRFLATGGSEPIKIWDAFGGTNLRTMENSRSENGIAWSPDGAFLASAEDRTVRVWDATSGHAVRDMQGHQDSVSSVTWSPDGNFVATAGADRTIRLWEARSGKSIVTFSGHRNSVESLAWSPEKPILASVSRDGSVRLWEAAPQAGDGPPASVVAWSPRGQVLAYLAPDNSVRLWNPSNHNAPAVLQGDQGGVVNFAWSADGASLATIGGNSSVRLWDTMSGRLLRILQEGDQGYYYGERLVWGPNGKTLAAHGTTGETIRVWNSADGRLLRAFEARQLVPSSVVWSPDGKTMAAIARNATVRLWDASDGRQIRTLPGPQGGTGALAWSPDGKILASSGEIDRDQTIGLWDLETGRQLQTLRGHQGSVQDLAWSPDGKTLAAACGKAGAVLWETAAGRVLRTLHGGISSVSWSPDGNIIATAGSDGIRLWPGTVDALLEQARHAIRLYVPSQSECRQYLGTDICPPVR